ncbi:MAG: hypothetical protein E7352_04335 [Clostridiales bacterium]|nr:hypothetical protein [Clostridiales bacterium]
MQRKWIWANNDQIEQDSYAEFIGCFHAENTEKVLLNIACDSIYNVEINGALAAFGACADYPHRKYYDSVDITKYCKAENEIKITVWYLGYGCSNYKIGERGLAFEILQGDNVLLASSKDILSRKNINYKNGYCKLITSQLGLSFLYDNTVENTLPFAKSEEKGERAFEPRGRKNCVLNGRVPVTISKIENGYRIAWERETVGFLELDFVSPKEQKLTIAYGEHLGFGKVLRHNGEQDFSVEFVAKAGENQYRNAFRRLAGRYLDIECETELDIRYIGLNEVLYPLEKKVRTFADPLSQKIYDVCVHTLVCCMHDRYEDCPWREQSLYVMDSRNQMLCGYYAFDGTEFPAANLRLIADGLRQDGLLDICYPTGKKYAIPFFSLIFPMQVYEYQQYTGDNALVETLIPTIRQILDGFEKHIDETGLIPALKGHWNYYEWTEGSYADGEFGGAITPTHYDLILNCAYIFACDYFEKLTGEKRDTMALKETIKRHFYNEEKGLYKLCLSGKERYSQLGNAFAYLIGLDNTPAFAKRLFSKELIEASLSMRSFYYDALLQADEKNKDFILNDIKTRYKKMLDAGATTFWETELGWQDTIGFAGSLCHGWSALPIYYLCKYEQ